MQAQRVLTSLHASLTAGNLSPSTVPYWRECSWPSQRG